MFNLIFFIMKKFLFLFSTVFLLANFTFAQEYLQQTRSHAKVKTDAYGEKLPFKVVEVVSESNYVEPLMFYKNDKATFNESFDAAVFPPTGWTDVAGTYHWTRVTSGTTPTCAPYSGAGMIGFNCYSISSGSAEIATPAFDLRGLESNTSAVTFWMYRDAGYATDPDRVVVYANTSATSAGGTIIGTVNRNLTLTPAETVAGWYEYSFDLPAEFNGLSNYIIFKGISDFGNNIFIDDISWTDFPLVVADDAGITAITSPTAGYAGMYDVVATLKNFGTNTLATCDILYDINGITGTYTWNGTLAQNETENVTIIEDFDFTTGDTYVIDIKSDLTDDEDGSNDQTVVSVEILEPLTLPVYESFDETTLPALWVNQYAVGTTNWTTATANGNSSVTPRTGDRMALFITSVTNNKSKLVSRRMDFSGVVNNVQLSFYYTNVKWAEDIDELRVYYKTSAAGEWIQIGDNYTAEQTAWTQVKLTLPDVSADYYIAFEGTSNWARGVTLDDVTIEEVLPPANEAMVVSVASDFAFASDAVTPMVVVKNNGTNTATFDVVLDITDGVNPPYTETVTVTDLAPEAEFNPVFADVTFMYPGLYDVTATIDWADDEDVDNNSKTATYTVFTSEENMAFAYTIYNEAGLPDYAPVVYDLTMPEILVPIADHSADPYTVRAGEFANGTWYAVDRVDATSTNRLISIDFETGEKTVLNATFSHFFSDMAFDWSTRTLYGMYLNTATTYTLATIDLVEQTVTVVGTDITGTPITLACDLEGNLYSIFREDGSLYMLSKEDGTPTSVGATGVTDINYIQSMSFDHRNGDVLYWNQQGDTDYGDLYTVDSETGAATSVGTLQGKAEIVAFAIPFIPTYTVTYDANSMNATGDVPTDMMEYAEGETVTVLGQNDLAVENFTFEGWNTQADGMGATYVENDEFQMGIADITLYAVWNQLPFAGVLTFQTTQMGEQSTTATNNVYDLGDILSSDALSGLTVEILDDAINTATIDVFYNGSDFGNMVYNSEFEIWVFQPEQPFVWEEGLNTLTATFTDMYGYELEILVNFNYVTVYTATFNVDMLEAMMNETFDAAADQVWLTGSAFDWNVPGTGKSVQLSDDDMDGIYTVIVPNVTVGQFEYKYFLLPTATDGWERGEWSGGANRPSEIVDADIEINDYFGGYFVEFNVTDGTNPLEGAEVVVTYITKGMWQDMTDGLGDAYGVFPDGTYTITVTLAGYVPFSGQMTVSQHAVDYPQITLEPVSVSNISNSQISVYPNPSNGVFTVSTTEAMNLQVTDITGKIVNEMNVNGTRTLNIESAGMYFLRFANENGTSVQRVIVK